ncbi:membrane protein insertase YidC [Capnocytophaga sp. ARDL2]|uniref:membrane protein insertase YidC n=1 Tax=Capnocytophaga sp. ARDL2 TaxID=3238809 RepID=UPI00355764F2
MEKGKLDTSSLIGMGLLGALLFWFMQTPKNEETKKQETTEQVATATTTLNNATQTNDSLNSHLTEKYGVFAYGVAKATDQEVVVKNDVFTIAFDTKGGYIKTLEINDQKRKTKESYELVKLIADNNSALNLTFTTQDNRIIQTKDIPFVPTVTKQGDTQIVSMKMQASETAYLEYRYEIKKDEYMIGFSLQSVGLNQVLNAGTEPKLNWTLKAFSNEKSLSYENRYTEVVYEYENGKDDYLNPGKTASETVKDVTYIAFKQHLFTSILLTDQAFATATVAQENYDEENEEFLKNFTAEIPLAYKGGELNYSMNWYFGPADYNILNKYDKNLDEVLNLGWGIFGWLNKILFIPIFNVLTSILPYGLSIIFLTIVIRLLMSPIQYKSFVSQAKMKVIRPEVMELNEKFKNDPMKKQQETMKLYSKAGVNPMAGCLPMFLQLPVFYALFMFFPAAFDLRQKSFLWADDLSSYDSIIQLPFTIPFYGNHVSLFPILAALATFVYMKMTTGDQTAMQPAQEGMPDMSKIMKIMIYISPVMMLFFFNNYASGLSLYYFVSNVLTIGIMFVIKKYIVTEEKVKAIIEENKTKERPKSKFQQRMEQMMEQAQQQQKNRK